MLGGFALSKRSNGLTVQTNLIFPYCGKALNEKNFVHKTNEKRFRYKK